MRGASTNLSQAILKRASAGNRVLRERERGLLRDVSHDGEATCSSPMSFEGCHPWYHKLCAITARSSSWSRKPNQLLIIALLLWGAAPALAQTTPPTQQHMPLQKTIGQAKPEIVPSLIVMNARGASLQGGKLALNGVAPNSIVFADRPVRAAGHSLTTDLLEEWSKSNDSDESFTKDPPNATVSVFSTDGSKVRDAVVVLKTAKLEGDRLTFDVECSKASWQAATGRRRSSSIASASAAFTLVASTLAASAASMPAAASRRLRAGLSGWSRRRSWRLASSLRRSRCLVSRGPIRCRCGRCRCGRWGRAGCGGSSSYPYYGAPAAITLIRPATEELRMA